MNDRWPLAIEKRNKKETHLTRKSQTTCSAYIESHFPQVET